jgi:outer membrane protein OmpA-like peptidoglycan-associated protein
VSRRLLAALIALPALIAIGTAQLGPNRDRIEDDLTRRATAALIAAGQPDARVFFTGRDGLVVTSASASARAHDVVAAVDGVRAVRTRVVVTQTIPDRVQPRVRGVTERVRAAMAGGAAHVRLQRELAAVPAIVFESGGAELTAESRTALRRTAALLRSHPDTRIRVEGHADSRGASQTNLALSRDRAEAVRSVLAEFGVPADRMTVAGYGESRPKAANDTPAHRAENRRVELTTS